MTCIAMITHRGQVWAASDSRCSTDDGCVHQAGPKVFRMGDVVVGLAGDGGSERLIGLIDWSARDLTTEILKHARQIDQDPAGFDAVIGRRGRIYYYEDRFVYENEHRYGAIGSGCWVALGYLAGTAGVPPAERLRGAVRTAIEHVPTCGGRVHLVKGPAPPRKK